MEGQVRAPDQERERRMEKRALSRALSAVGLTLLLYLLAASSTSLPVNLLRRLWQAEGVEITASMAQMVNMASYAYSILVPLLFLALFQGPRRAGRPLFPLGLPRRGVFLPALGVCLGVCTTSNYLSTWLAMLLQENFPDTLPAYRAAIPTQGLPLALGLISAAVLPAILEELLFRGAILQGLRPYGDGYAILLSALAFALCHTTVPQLLPALLAGLCFGYFAVMSGSLWVTILIHCFYNLLAAAVELAGSLGGEEMQMLVSVSISAASLLCCLGGFLALCRRFRDDLGLRGRYRGSLSLPRRWLAAAANLPLLLAAVLLCWTTWSPLLEEVLAP